MVALHQDRVQRSSQIVDGVSDGYRHYEKRVEARDPFITNQAHLKWYDIGYEAIGVAPGLQREAKEFLVNEIQSGSLESPGRVGFVMLHDCGEVIFLIVCTWNGNNELWETVYVKRPELGGSFRNLRVPGDHRPTYCVWEMAVVTHEARTWSTYLLTDRTAADVAAYLENRIEGVVS